MFRKIRQINSKKIEPVAVALKAVFQSVPETCKKYASSSDSGTKARQAIDADGAIILLDLIGKAQKAVREAHNGDDATQTGQEYSETHGGATLQTENSVGTADMREAGSEDAAAGWTSSAIHNGLLQFLQTAFVPTGLTIEAPKVPSKKDIHRAERRAQRGVARKALNALKPSDYQRLAVKELTKQMQKKFRRSVDDGLTDVARVATLDEAREIRDESGDVVSRKKLSYTSFSKAALDPKEDRAADVYGFTREVLAAALESSVPGIREAFNDMARCIVNNVVPPFTARILACQRKVGIPKKQTAEEKAAGKQPTQRPLGLLPSWTYAIEKERIEHMREAIKKEVLPIQCGAGMQAGRELYYFRALLLLKKRRKAAMLQVDVKGAYDNVSRTEVLKAVKRTVPNMLPYVSG